MSANTKTPIPKNLREQVIERVSEMSDDEVLRLHELMVLNEKLRLRDEISEQAEQERAAGKWDNLAELIQAYRSRNKGG